MKKYLYIGIVAVFVAMFVTISIQRSTIKQRTEERDRYRNNTESLMNDVEKYQVSDSLNAARVRSLSLSIDEYKRFRSDDAEIIRKLRIDTKDMQNVISTQSKTILSIENALIRDSLIYVEIEGERIVDTIRCIEYHDQWTDIVGCSNGNLFMENRDKLLLTTDVKFKKFLFWNTKKIKSQTTNAVNMNPRTTINELEHIIVVK
jgi:hypothetical protein